MNVALDFEGVLADTHSPTIDESESLTRDDFQQWDFGSQEKYEEFMRVSQNIVTDEIETVEPVESKLSDITASIATKHTVDIVTARWDADEELQWWLDQFGIEYDDFVAVPPQRDKIEYEKYDIYVDDNPKMVRHVEGSKRDVTLLLRDQPWNRHVMPEGSVYRINSVRQLCDPTAPDAESAISLV